MEKGMKESARWDLCGGPPERAVPTANRRSPSPRRHHAGSYCVRLPPLGSVGCTFVFAIVTVREPRTPPARRMTLQRSDADDVDEIAEPGEVVGISGVEREAVGVRGGSNEQVGNTPSM